MEQIWSLNKLRASELSNIVFWLTPVETMKLLMTCKKFYALREKNDIWMKIFEAKQREVEYTQEQLLAMQGVIPLNKTVNWNEFSKKSKFWGKFHIQLINVKYDFPGNPWKETILIFKILYDLLLIHHAKRLHLKGIKESSFDEDQTIH
jgi:hypothetical protein